MIALTKYKRGERLRADTVNALIDAASELPGVEALAAMWRAGASPWPIPYKYSGSQEVPPFGVLDVTGPATLANKLGVNARKIPADSGSAPELRRLYLVNGPTPCRPNGSGWGSYLTSGGWVKYSGSSTTFFSEWGPQPDSFEIGPNRYGFIPTGQATNKYGGVFEATQYVVSRVIALPDVIGQPMDYKSKVRCKVFSGAPGFEFPNGFYVSDVYSAGRDIPSGEGIRVEWFNGYPYGTPLFAQITVVCKPTADINKGDIGNVTVWDVSGSTGTGFAALAQGAKVKGNKFCVAWQEALTGQWYVGPWEC